MSIKNKSHAVTAEIVVPEGGAQGVIIAQGGSIGGWALYAKSTAGCAIATTCSASSASTSRATG